jgi:hypothetical protein
VTENAISLYFSLKPGERADLEVVAQAALEWVDAVRAAALELDPEAQIRVELLSADESSLSLNTILEWVEKHLGHIEEGVGRYPRIVKLAIALAIFVPVSGVPTWHFYFGDNPTISLNAEDRKLLMEFIEQTRKNPGVKAKQQKFFKTLERDPSISGAGITEGPRQPPIILVPSNQFAERSGLWAILSEDEQERTTYPVVEVVLVTPVLVPAPRAWTFRPEGLPEFTATMKDRRFLEALAEDSVKERLRIGIPMTLRLEVKEKKVGGAWVTKKRGGRSVIEVISPRVE